MLRLPINSLKNAPLLFDVCLSQRKIIAPKMRKLTSSRNYAKPKKSFMVFGLFAGCGAGVGYAVYNYRKEKEPIKAILNSTQGVKSVYLDQLPNVEVSRRVKYFNDNSGLKLILFQYPTCPFCCKVRAFLDAYGLSYDVVEVNPVLRQQLKWTDYKKVPILLVKTEKGFLQLNDSSMIISTLQSYFLENDVNLSEVAEYYPPISYKDEDGKVKTEILNRYFIMYKGKIPDNSTKESIDSERNWRKWADNVLVHTLSPNVYRTREEALQAFNWFSEVGEWDKLFSTWEKYLVVYVGALAMWMIGKRLKKRHNLKDDVRESLYDECNVWIREVNKTGGQFHGGSEPNLADLAVYGVLTSIEGCYAFTDLMSKTKLSLWYQNMKSYTSRHPHS